MQLLFCLLDCRHFIDVAVVTLQKEVAEVNTCRGPSEGGPSGGVWTEKETLKDRERDGLKR